MTSNEFQKMLSIDLFSKGYNSIKGSFIPEQFGVFLNMSSSEIGKNYLIQFHEHFHYWQSIFTPYGHLKWACSRDFSNEVVRLWSAASEETPKARTIPAGGMLPCKNIKQVSCVSQIFVQDIVRRTIALTERAIKDDVLQRILPINIDDICPRITIFDKEYKMNGIDILESFAKFQEAVFALLVDNVPFSETIDINRLSPEYYSAYAYFIEHIGPHRGYEFPVLCELALATDHLCHFEEGDAWKDNHPAWRFIKLVELAASYYDETQLNSENIREYFDTYSKNLLQKCFHTDLDQCWDSAISYATQTDLKIPLDMLKSLDFKKKHPWILSFPLLDLDTFLCLKEFHPYYYITSDMTSYTVPSEYLGQEVIFELHYQALAHQICGNMSPRCMDRWKLQCGFSYYGLKNCPYQQDGSCDGHIDCHSNMPPIKTDANSNILEGCLFELLFSLMGIKIRELNVVDIKTKINADKLSENAKEFAGRN